MIENVQGRHRLVKGRINLSFCFFHIKQVDRYLGTYLLIVYIFKFWYPIYVNIPIDAGYIEIRYFPTKVSYANLAQEPQKDHRYEVQQIVNGLHKLCKPQPRLIHVEFINFEKVPWNRCLDNLILAGLPN